MSILILFAFIAGLVTILSPCILPLLPIILAGGTTENKYRPLGIVVGFIASFSTATVALSILSKSIGLDANFLRVAAICIVLVFGLVLLVPPLRHIWEQIVSRHIPQGVHTDRSGFWGGVLIGASLGIVWTPCVGPILASVIALAATSVVTTATTLIVVAYALGTSIPLLGIMWGSSHLVREITWFKKQSGHIQQIFGALMVLTAMALWQGWDRGFQTYILNNSPQYGAGLTSIENQPLVNTKLQELQARGGTLSELKTYGDAPEITGGGKWLNSDPVTLRNLRGKVVLVDFWTYSCINCIRTLPYLKAWDEKYSPDGLVIIGVHTPEFEFEKDYENVQKAVQDFGIHYPVVQDNNFAIWQAYDNHYWPAKYLIDKEGKIRLIHFGEGKYGETEMAIRELLGEQSMDNVLKIPEVRVETRSPETYVGYKRLDADVSSPPVKHDQIVSYSAPVTIPLNSLAFSGKWIVHDEYAEPSPNSSLLYHFDAKVINLVMRPIEKGTPAMIEIIVDGQKLSTQIINEDRLYQLIKYDRREDHTIQILYPNGGVAVYAFTFG